MKWSISHSCRKTTTFLLLCLIPVCVHSPASAEESIRLSIVFSPGGALDAAARVLAREAEKELNIPVIVQNTASGGGMAGVARLAGARGDGSRLAACVSNTLIFIPYRNKTPYHPLKDMEPLLIFGQASPVLVTRPDSPWNDMESFLQAARSGKKKLRIGVPGLGTPSHIALAVMAAEDPSLQWRFVPFSGPGEAETALLGGHIDAAASGALPRIRSGQLHPLMVLAGSRMASLPQVPSLADGGFSDPGRGDSAFLLLAPAGVPEETLERLARAFEKAARSEAHLKTLENYSVVPLLKNREDAKTFLREAWKEEGVVLKAAGLADKPAASPE